MRIHQLVVSASRGDAITNAALQMRELFRQVGSSEIYARYFDASLDGDVVALKDYRANANAMPENDIICYHASIGEPDVLSFILDRPEQLVVIYHNISPPGPFRAYDPAFAGLLDAGRRELAQLAGRARMALADSEYNAAELRALGYRDVRVSSLIIDTGRLCDIEPDADKTHHLTAAVKGPMLLFVGQLLPHKRPDLLLKAFHVLVTYLLPEAHLTLVGAGRLPAYRRALDSYIRELNLGTAWITGAVSDAELAAFYRRADVFVTASEHEGFCVPLVEAMAFGVPVVARRFAAIPETLGDAGLVVPPDDDPLLLAEALAVVATDDAVRTGITAGVESRLAHYAPDAARASLLANLLEIA
jgi:glycosyltransferase involved in cell wall biosynthesis